MVNSLPDHKPILMRCSGGCSASEMSDSAAASGGGVSENGLTYVEWSDLFKGAPSSSDFLGKGKAT